MASKSRRPVLWRPPKVMRSNCSTSRVTSWQIASAVFFLPQPRVRFRWAHPTDLHVDFDKFLVQSLQLAEFGDLSFGLWCRSLVGQGFRDRLAIDFVRQTEVQQLPPVTDIYHLGQLTTFNAQVLLASLTSHFLTSTSRVFYCNHSTCPRYGLQANLWQNGDCCSTPLSIAWKSPRRRSSRMPRRSVSKRKNCISWEWRCGKAWSTRWCMATGTTPERRCMFPLSGR